MYYREINFPLKFCSIYDWETFIVGENCVLLQIENPPNFMIVPESLAIYLVGGIQTTKIRKLEDAVIFI